MGADRQEIVRTAYAEMICWMAEVVAKVLAWTPIADHPTLKNHVIMHYCDSPSEGMVCVLWSCGIIVPKDGTHATNDRLPSTYNFTVSREHIRDVAYSRFGKEPGFDQVLTAFIRRACAIDGLSADREPFSVGEHLLTIVDLLCDLGYASRRDNLYVWNDAIGPAMIETWFWTRDGQSRRALAQAALRRMIEELAEDVRLGVDSLVAQGQFLNAVVALRDSTGWPLSDAREAVEIMHPGLGTPD